MEDFIANAALLAGHLTQQCEKAVADQQATTANLQRTAAEVKQSVSAGKVELAQNARAAIREVLAEEIPSAVEAIAQTGDRLRVLADQLQREQSAAGMRARMLGWKALAAFVLAAVAIVGGTAYAAWHNVQRAERAHVQAEVLEALQQVAITACDGRPCVKLEDGLQRWSKNDEYVLLDGSAPAAAGKKN